ncbi:venom acid phosphatase Acph-1 [Halyomorpha halys]|uniref:venom acid phosphatase Acph-1 n=1 Tax=Halyomorpha halys TaxID=286706 RepID=UPI0006D50C0B|nr:venom acid phosphatase Acph-1-like [Halyomorpha halys]
MEVSVLRFLFLVLHISYFVNCQSSDATSLLAKPTLVRVFVALRHGSRAPSYETYVNDSYLKTNEQIWPAGPGELTKNGKQEAFEMGQKLRTRYSEFLSDYYKTKEFRAFSTLKERTMMTAELAAAGLFPPEGFQKWNSELAWQPVPVFPDYVINQTDDLNCKWIWPVSKAEMKNTPASEFGLDKDDLRLLQDHIGLYNEDPFTFMSKLWDVWDTIFYQDKENLPLPQWTKTLYPDKMPAAVLKFVKFYLSGSTTRKMMLMGPYGKGLASYFTKSERKMELHAWHDMNMISLMTTLGVEIEKYPDPTATVAIELHKKNEEYYFEVYYYSNHKENIPKLMKMPCGTNCSSSTIIKQLQTYAQANIEELCEKEKAKLNATNSV